MKFSGTCHTILWSLIYSAYYFYNYISFIGYCISSIIFIHSWLDMTNEWNKAYYRISFVVAWHLVVQSKSDLHAFTQSIYDLGIRKSMFLAHSFNWCLSQIPTLPSMVWHFQRVPSNCLGIKKLAKWFNLNPQNPSQFILFGIEYCGAIS